MVFRMISVILLALICLLWPFNDELPPQPESLSLCFTGDIMGHDRQIEAALNLQTGEYDYTPALSPMVYLLQSADYTIGNLEVTLAGAPYRGYPCFSSPDALVNACQVAGFDVLLTANNHQWDRGSKGHSRTLSVLDAMGFHRTGSFLNEEDRRRNGMVRLSKNGIQVGLLNYTYGVNGSAVRKPHMINHIDTLQIARDIQEFGDDELDKLVVVLHWGKEYHHQPSLTQKRVARFLFSKGVDVVIGHHPHVLQPMEYHAPTDSTDERILVYSLGNFVSNMRNRSCDGGAIFTLEFIKENGSVSIGRSGYDLHWTHCYQKDGRPVFEVLPVNDVGIVGRASMSSASHQAMDEFTAHARDLFDSHNVHISEWSRGGGQ